MATDSKKFLDINGLSYYNDKITGKIDDIKTDVSDFKNTVNGKMAVQDGDIQALESRMDSFSSLTEGSTTGDAELIDGRISFDGRTFANIGDNIRNYQDKGYTDITSTLTEVSGKYMNRDGAEQTLASFNYYILQTKKDIYYFIDTIAGDSAPQVIYGKMTQDTNHCIPSTLGSGQYDDTIIIKGNGGNFYINNKSSNTHFYVGEMEDIVNYSETSEYFIDITASSEATDGKYVSKLGTLNNLSAFRVHAFTPKAGKYYRIFTSWGGGAILCYQENGVIFPSTNNDDSATTRVANYYDIFCTNTSTVYVNEYKGNMFGSDFKIYESRLSYYIPNEDETIKADVGAFNKAFFIGDSLTYGQTYTASNASYRNYFNYPHYLQKLLGIDEITEVARGGATSTSWWNTYAGTIDQSDCIYFIWLGTNDTYTDTVATDCAGDDYTHFADTATGNLGKIVGKVASMSNVKIVMLNNFGTVGDKAINNKVIGDIAQKYNALVVDVDTTQVHYNGYHTAYNGYYNGVHFNNQGHNYIANLVSTQLNSYMNSNKGSMEIYKEHS